MDQSPSTPPDKVEKRTANPSSGAGSGETSRPLVPLVPAQRRPSRGNELGIKRLSKARQGNEILKPTPRHAHSPWLKDQEIRGRHSAPGFGSDIGLGTELRESKSAPDLRQPVLAAIRGLQDGSIQVDFRTRARIAHAARKVLEAREVQRRAHQGNTLLQGADLMVPGIALEKLAGKSIGPTDGIVQDILAAMPNVKAPAAGTKEPRDVTMDNPAHQDVAMEVPSPTSLTLPPQGQLTHPFTVTTGVPQFPQDGPSGGLQTTITGQRTRSMPGPSLESIEPKS